MLEDYAVVISRFHLRVAIAGSRVVGEIVLKVVDGGFYVDSVAVRPSVQDRGIGRLLLELAETQACRQGFKTGYLATHELMTENRGLYSRFGYVEYDHGVVNGYPRVFSRKEWP